MVDVSNLNDFEILNLKKHEENLHVELRELIDKVSGFEKFVIPCGEKANKLRKDVLDWRDKGATYLKKYLTAVNTRMSDRDISEKKLQTSAFLDIQIPKFDGYNSEMDIYTFKAEFKKLVEPFVQRDLWADHLKKNLMSGSALNIILKIEKMDEIWKKLIEVSGIPTSCSKIK